jgi:hypothetical protein
VTDCKIIEAIEDGKAIYQTKQESVARNCRKDDQESSVTSVPGTSRHSL